MPKYTKQVFLSYAQADHDYVARLKEALSRTDVAVSDHRSLAPGENFNDALLAGVRAADLLVFVVPRHEGEGKTALVELGIARGIGKDILIVLPDATRYPNASVPSNLRGTLVFDASRASADAIAEEIASAASIH